MATDPSLPPQFGDLLARAQELLAQLAAQHEGATRELAGQQAELRQVKGELTQVRAQHRQLQQELEAYRSAQQTWTAERQRLASERDQLAKERDQLAKDNEGVRQTHSALSAENQELRATQEKQETMLSGLHAEREQLHELHSHVTAQTSKLAADWSARRDALAADKQRLSGELDEARKALAQGQDREKQWRAQVWKLQDEVKTLRGATGRVALTPEQSHHVYSQLNAIIGFAEVLLDEAGNRATGTERQEYLQHIKTSGNQLVGYIKRLMGAPATASAAAGEPADDLTPPVLAPGAPSVLVAASDPAVRERIEPFLLHAGYRVEFADTSAEALKIAVDLQPLAIVIDADLPPKGAQPLIDDLFGEPRARDIPVVLTVKNEEEQLGLSMAQYDLLRKPISRQQVLQVMAKYDLLADRRRASKMPTTVLVVDDDPRNTRLVQAMLKPFSIEVLSANDGTTGVKLARTRKPDLIILDLMMPEVDGFAVISELRGDAATAQTPILIYTAKNLTSADRERLQGNIQAIIRKGELTKEQFLEIVYRRGERRRRAPAEEAAA